jgi:hypothetical protein
VEALTSATAAEIYRSAWSSWLLVPRERDKLRYQALMDSVQSTIARGPRDPVWQAFIDTLPGFRDYWATVSQRLAEEQRGAR